MTRNQKLKYVGFFTKLLIGFGIAFELPVITFFLAKIGLVNDQMLKDFFRYAVVLIFIIAALLTPPDVVSQLLMAAPLLILYGVSIYIAKVFNPAQKEEGTTSFFSWSYKPGAKNNHNCQKITGKEIINPPKNATFIAVKNVS